MTTSARWTLTAVLLEIAAVITFCLAYASHQWDGRMLLAVVFALGGIGASFGSDE